MSDAANRYDDQLYLSLRRRAHRRAKRLGIDFTAAFNLVAQEDGFRSAQHAIHWLIPSDWWCPCDPPAEKVSAVQQSASAEISI